MKHKIKQIILLDGKMFLYPTDTEMKNLANEIATVEIIETMTREEFNIYCNALEMDKAAKDAVLNGVGITRVEFKEYYKK